MVEAQPAVAVERDRGAVEQDRTMLAGAGPDRIGLRARPASSRAPRRRRRVRPRPRRPARRPSGPRRRACGSGSGGLSLIGIGEVARGVAAARPSVASLDRQRSPRRTRRHCADRPRATRRAPSQSAKAGSWSRRTQSSASSSALAISDGHRRAPYRRATESAPSVDARCAAATARYAFCRCFSTALSVMPSSAAMSRWPISSTRWRRKICSVRGPSPPARDRSGAGDRGRSGCVRRSAHRRHRRHDPRRRCDRRSRDLAGAARRDTGRASDCAPCDRDRRADRRSAPSGDACARIHRSCRQSSASSPAPRARR